MLPFISTILSIAREPTFHSSRAIKLIIVLFEYTKSIALPTKASDVVKSSFSAFLYCSLKFSKVLKEDILFSNESKKIMYTSIRSIVDTKLRVVRLRLLAKCVSYWFCSEKILIRYIFCLSILNFNERFLSLPI